MSPLLASVRVLEIGGRGAAVAGRLFAELGAAVTCVRIRGATAPDAESRLFDAHKHVLDRATLTDPRRRDELLARADLVVIELPHVERRALGLEPDAIAAGNPRAVVASISPFGMSGSHRDYRGSDLIAFHAAGIARLLTGHVEDAEREPPVRAAGEQADFITGLTAACAGMHALYGCDRHGRGQVIDVSAQEALALMAARELAMPGFGGVPAPRAGAVRGGGAVIHVLPASDGYVAVSPREEHQWRRWLGVLGDPPWSARPEFATRADRTAHFDALYPLMAEWSRSLPRAEIFERCQSAHVPCFPFGMPGDMLGLEQLRHRGFFAPADLGLDAPVLVPRPPFGLPPDDYAPADDAGDADEAPASLPPAPPARAREANAAAGGPAALPLAGVRVLDLSWVIAGPTCTRYLALMGADVIKVEAPDRPDTGRVSELHDVLGQSKRALALDLKAPGALEALRGLVARSDVVVENFATGVMERLGLGYETLREIRPDIVLLSASGLGRTGPDAGLVAYGNLLSAFSGFSTLNGFPGREPRTGLAWADPLCGLLMAFGVVAALHRRDRGGGGRHIDFSMLEALLWTMPRALIAAQRGETPEPAGNADPELAPHGVYRCAEDDRWLAIAVTDDDAWRALCGVVRSLAGLSALSRVERRERAAEIDARLDAWTRERDALDAMGELQAAGVAAAASYSTSDLFADAHLWERRFYRTVTERDGTERWLPALPWRWGDDAQIVPRAAPGLGEHSEFVLRTIAGLDEAAIAALRDAGALGVPPG